MRWSVAAILLAGVLLAGLTARAEAPLTADQVMQRAVTRASSPEHAAFRPDYKYHKHTVTDELDAKGRLKERKEKVYEVHVENGLSTLMLIQVNGQDLSTAELKKASEREAVERAKLTDTKPGRKGDNRENFLTAELVERYKLTLARQQMVNGRLCYVIDFEPSSATLPVKKLTDRFLNQMTGTVWIDAQEFEIAKAQVHLRAEVALWGGMVGTLRRCDYTLIRTRLPDGVWFNSFSHGIFEGRKLLETMNIRTMSESSDFSRLAMAR